MSDKATFSKLFYELLLAKDILRVFARAWEEGDMGSCGLLGIEFQFCKMQKFWSLIAQQHECI